MAVHISGSRWVSDPSRPQGARIIGVVAGYTLDSPGDVNDLPGIESVLPGSTAFIPSAQQAFMLDGNGWQPL